MRSRRSWNGPWINRLVISFLIFIAIGGQVLQRDDFSRHGMSAETQLNPDWILANVQTGQPRVKL